jgi:hypothetical protein
MRLPTLVVRVGPDLRVALADPCLDVGRCARVGSPHFARHWSAEAQVPWLFNASSGTWITYDDSQSVAAKADYVRTRRLGGLAI